MDEDNLGLSIREAVQQTVEMDLGDSSLKSIEEGPDEEPTTLADLIDLSKKEEQTEASRKDPGPQTQAPVREDPFAELLLPPIQGQEQAESEPVPAPTPAQKVFDDRGRVLYDNSSDPGAEENPWADL